MHIPDGFIDAPTSIAYGVVAAAGIGWCLRKGSAELDERAAPLAGLTAAFVFAGQMLNFPVAAGTSGHLLGGVLAAVLVGPWVGATCLAVVLLLQALFFADGGLTALGLSTVNMSFVGALGGYAVYRLLLRLLPRRSASVPLAAAIAAALSVPMAAASFVLQFAIGGTVDDLSMSAVLTAMSQGPRPSSASASHRRLPHGRPRHRPHVPIYLQRPQHPAARADQRSTSSRPMGLDERRRARRRAAARAASSSPGSCSPSCWPASLTAAPAPPRRPGEDRRGRRLPAVGGGHSFAASPLADYALCGVEDSGCRARPRPQRRPHLRDRHAAASSGPSSRVARHRGSTSSGGWP